MKRTREKNHQPDDSSEVHAEHEKGDSVDSGGGRTHPAMCNNQKENYKLKAHIGPRKSRNKHKYMAKSMSKSKNTKCAIFAGMKGKTRKRKAKAQSQQQQKKNVAHLKMLLTKKGRKRKQTSLLLRAGAKMKNADGTTWRGWWQATWKKNEKQKCSGPTTSKCTERAAHLSLYY